jgi:hypothetical protein
MKLLEKLNTIIFAKEVGFMLTGKRTTPAGTTTEKSSNSTVYPTAPLAQEESAAKTALNQDNKHSPTMIYEARYWFEFGDKLQYIRPENRDTAYAIDEIRGDIKKLCLESNIDLESFLAYIRKDPYLLRISQLIVLRYRADLYDSYFSLNYSKLDKRNAALEDDVKNLRDRLREKQKEVDDYANQSGKDGTNNKTVQIGVLQLRIDSLNSRIRELEGDAQERMINDMSAESKPTSQTTELLAQEESINDRLNDEANSVKERVVDLEALLRTNSVEIETLVTSNKELSDQLKDEANSDKKRIVDLEALLRTNSVEIEHLVKNRNELNDRLQKYKKRIAAKDSKLEAVKIVEKSHSIRPATLFPQQASSKGMDISKSIRFKTTVSNYKKVFSEISDSTDFMMFIDPFFDFEMDEYYYLIDLFRNLPPLDSVPRIEIHQSATKGRGGNVTPITPREIEETYKNILRPLLKENILSVHVFLWLDMHDRFFITDKVGYLMGTGFADNPGAFSQVTWSLLSDSDRDDVQIEYDPSKTGGRLFHKFHLSNDDYR